MLYWLSLIVTEPKGLQYNLEIQWFSKLSGNELEGLNLYLVLFCVYILYLMYYNRPVTFPLFFDIVDVFWQQNKYFSVDVVFVVIIMVDYLDMIAKC